MNSPKFRESSKITRRTENLFLSPVVSDSIWGWLGYLQVPILALRKLDGSDDRWQATKCGRGVVILPYLGERRTLDVCHGESLCKVRGMWCNMWVFRKFYGSLFQWNLIEIVINLVHTKTYPSLKELFAVSLNLKIFKLVPKFLMTLRCLEFVQGSEMFTAFHLIVQ